MTDVPQNNDITFLDSSPLEDTCPISRVALDVTKELRKCYGNPFFWSTFYGSTEPRYLKSNPTRKGGCSLG